MFNSVRTRLILVTIALTIIPLIIVGASITLRGYTVLQDQSVEFQSALAQRTSTRLEAFFSERQTELFALTHIAGLDTLPVAEQRNVLLTLLSEGNAYYQLTIAGADGMETLRITRGEVVTDRDLIDRSDDPVFQNAVATGSVSFSPVYFNEVARDRLVTMAVPMEDLFTGETASVLMAEIRFQTIGDAVLREANAQDGEDVFIIDAQGTILAHRNPSLVIRGMVFEPPAAEGRAAGVNGDDVILATDTIQLATQDLTVVATTSFANATALANDLTGLAVGIIFVALVLSVVVIAFAATRLINPIIDMAKVASAVEKGDLSARASEKGAGEIAQLGHSFNRMTAELQRTLENLRANEARLAATVAALPDVLFNVKVDGTMVDMRIPTTSPLYSAYTSTPSTERSIGRNLKHSLPAEVFEPFMEKLQTSVRTGELQTFEYATPVQTAVYDLEARIVKVNDEQAVVIARDVTEQKQRTKERERLIRDLEAAKRLAEENSRLKSEFLSTMSHELRTPLNAIEGFTGVVLKRIGGAQFNDKTEDYLKRVHSNSRRLLQLINDFLDLSRVEAGRLELANQAFEPARLAQRWRDEISVLAEKKGLSFDHVVDPEMPEMLYGDEEAISKVAINLLSNAIKFTEQGGVSLKIDRRDGNWDIIVSDTGIGIPPHAREFIFEEFRQVDQTSKRKYGGTGLGLAIVQKYTRSMGGNVSVRSELGQGSTFTVTLPLKTTA